MITWLIIYCVVVWCIALYYKLMPVIKHAIQYARDKPCNHPPPEEYDMLRTEPTLGVCKKCNQWVVGVQIRERYIDSILH